MVAGAAAQRRKQIASGAEVIIVNWEALRTHSRLAPYGSYALKRCVECGGSGTVSQAQCEVHEREFNTIDFGAVVADEVHRAKDPASAQTRALRAASGDAKIRFGLTGTPIANDVTELWSILHWVDEQEWPAKTAWVERLVDFIFNIWGGMEVSGIKPGLETEFHAGIDPKMRRMTKAVVLPFLPPIVNERRDVEMHPPSGQGVRGDARPADRQARRRRADGREPDGAGQPAAAAGLLLRRRVHRQGPGQGQGDRRAQAGPGHRRAALQDEEHLMLTDPSSKLDAYMGDLDDFGDASTIVFAESRQLIEMLSGRMTKAGIMHGLITGAISEAERERNIANFQEGYTQHILCTLKAGGVGITLTKASAVVNLQRSWSSIDMSQAIARAHRIGSEDARLDPVVDYVTPGTVELAQIAALARKGDMLEEIVRDEALLRKLLMGEPVV